LGDSEEIYGRIKVSWNSAVEPVKHMDIMTLHREIYRPQHMYMEFFMKTMTPTHVFHELGGILAQLLTQIGMPGREEQLEKASGVHRFIGHLSCHGHQCHESLFGNLMVTMKYRYFQRILNVSFFTWHIYIYIYI